MKNLILLKENHVKNLFYFKLDDSYFYFTYNKIKIRIINNYALFSSFLSKMNSYLNNWNKLGFVQLDLIAWVLEFVNYMIHYIIFFLVELIIYTYL